MHQLRRAMMIFVFAALIFGSNSVSYANDWYVPKAMTSVDAAIASINELKGFVVAKTDYSVQTFNVNQQGIQISSVQEGVKQETTDFWIGWDHIKLPSNVPYRNEDYWVLAFNKVKSIHTSNIGPNLPAMIEIKPYGYIKIATIEHAHKFADAVLTLALAQNATLDPIYNIVFLDTDSKYAGSKYVADALKVAKVPAGAVVYWGATTVEPGWDFLEDDVIVQANYGDKAFPISGGEGWNVACREAVAGKAEVIITAKIIRNGIPMDKQVRVINPGFGVSVMPSNPTTPLAMPPKGFGLSLRAIEANEAKTLGLNNANGFVVLSVEKDSAAEEMQIKQNDVLIALNGVDITSPTQLKEIVTKGPITSAKVFRAGAILLVQAPLII